MDEMVGVWGQLRRDLKQDLPEVITTDLDVRGFAKDYLEAETGETRDEAWGDLRAAVQRLLRIYGAGAEDRSRQMQRVTEEASQDMRKATLRDLGDTEALDKGWFVSDRTSAMTNAMSALFALIGDQIPQVKAFRKRVLPGRLLTPDEARALIASYVARTLPLDWFDKWRIPFVGHYAEVLDQGPRGADFSPVNHWMTIRVTPPGVIKTVRYAYPQAEDPDTHWVDRDGAIVPIYTQLPIGPHGNPSWLWPGSVVDELYELSVMLAEAFDWPLASGDDWGMRPRSESATLFILTGEAPKVRPIDARWETKHGSMHLNPQWRIRLMIPPWLPEDEVLRAFRTLRRQRPEGRQMPKTAKPLEVARFVWKRDRLDGYRDPAPWTEWVELWNAEHPEHRFKSASHFRTYFFRGDAAVKHLNFDWPNF